MHERKTQRWIDKSSLSEPELQIMSATMLGMSHVVLSLKMQIQSNNFEITWKTESLEDGELAHSTLAFWC